MVNEFNTILHGIYTTGAWRREPRLPERPNEGIAAGPLVRFLEAAGKPLKIEFSEDAWRSRVRTILKGNSG